MYELQCSMDNVHDWLVYKLCDITKNSLDFDNNKLDPFYVKGAVLLDKPTDVTQWIENNILGMDLILFKIISLTASVMAKCLCKNPSERESPEWEAQNGLEYSLNNPFPITSTCRVYGLWWWLLYIREERFFINTYSKWHNTILTFSIQSTVTVCRGRYSYINNSFSYCKSLNLCAHI